ncbi:MAG: hypothetical protein IAE89_11515 [Anaerolineae bacterium]|nr:hypothetical protein [Anaerolineae bacterium]
MAIGGRCPECGGSWAGGKTCEAIFHEFLALEFENYNGEGEVHFYTVASYMIQHQRYSGEGFRWIREQLREALAGKLSIAEIQALAGKSAGQDKRSWKITRAEDTPIQPPLDWPITIVDVYEDVDTFYNQRILNWARTVVDTLDAETSAGG